MELNNTEMKMQYILDENKNLAEIPLTDMRPVEHPIKYKLVSAFEVFVRVPGTENYWISNYGRGINNYRNSYNFLKAVKEARKWQPDLDTLVIFAGACQSNYEALMKAGANYASSPGRIMIHALDPVFIVEKIACSRIDVVVPIEEILDQTITGVKGIGGFETRGKFRWAMPRPLL